jgi:hypothetical protein
MAQSVSINPVKKLSKKLFTGQRAPVAHPATRMSANKISELGTEGRSFIIKVQP